MYAFSLLVSVSCALNQGVYQYLAQLPDSGEKRYLENGMHALQRRSGPLRLAPDVSVITSLDVIIHYDRKLGEGGFTSVYEAHWKGTKVAVKVMGKGVPASVRVPSRRLGEKR